jgi:conjugal transfer mating pair stabilization protein TraG
MAHGYIRRKMRKIKISFRRMKLYQKAASFSALAVLLLLLVGMINSRPSIPMTAYSPLLDVIATAESKGNYNAYFSNAANKEINFTAMPIRDVIAWQEAFVKNGNPSSAVGKYQIIQPTLEGLVTELNISPDTHFDAATQDKLAVALIERRGSVAFIEDKLTAAEFAHNLSKEWAALPRIIGNAPESSYYAGDGLNASLVDSKTSLNAVEQFKLRGQK